MRPSLVYGAGSYDGTSPLRGLAALPVPIPLPGGGRQRFQPLHIDDLTRALLRLIEPDTPRRIVLEAVGTQVRTVREIVLGLRAWLGLAHAPILNVPRAVFRIVSWFSDSTGAVTGRGATRPNALKQMELDNTAPVEPFAAAVGFTPRSFEEGLAWMPSRVQDRWHARLYFLCPLCFLEALLVWFGLSGAGRLGRGEDTWLMWLFMSCGLMAIAVAALIALAIRNPR